MTPRPHILLAFANHPSPARKLDHLDKERRSIEDALRDNPYCVEIPMVEASLRKLESRFDSLKGDIRLLHFAGHAGGDAIEVEGDQHGQIKTAYAQGLAQRIAPYCQPTEGLHLVFLNACATEDQIRIFHNAGVKVVIATSQPLNDQVAHDFARHFYQQLAAGESIQTAYDRAHADLRGSYKPGEYYRTRSLEWMINEGYDARTPYLLRESADGQGAAQATLPSWAEQMRSRYQEPAPVGEKPAPAKLKPLGTETYLLVDRYPPNRDFQDTLRDRLRRAKRRPQAFILHGQDQERPQRLVERFKKFTLRQLFPQQVEPPQVFAPDPPIKLPRVEDFQTRDPDKPWLRLEDALRSSFHLQNYPKDLTASALMHRISTRTQVAFLPHRLWASQWHPGMKDLLDRYIRAFWDISLGEQAPFVILIFCLVYPDKSKGFSLKKRPEKQAEAALPDLACEECILLDKLPSVPIADVQEWRDDHLPFETNLDDDLYRRAGQLPMQEVEDHLKQAIERHNRRLT